LLEGINLATKRENYQAPRNKVEQELAQIWEELLGIKRIGIRDNFFELGGDSIITMQVVSRAKRNGIPMRPRDIFELQTIGAIAGAISQQQAIVQSEQGTLTGAVALSPIQQFYFENEYPGSDHYNQAILLEVDKEVGSPILSEAIKALLQRHDALRFSYSPTKSADGLSHWQQRYGNATVELQILDYTKHPEESLEQTIQQASAQLQSEMDLSRGQLFKAMLIQTPKETTNNRLFLAIQHLAVDGVSWRILLDDLERAIDAQLQGVPIQLGYKTASYREWVKSLNTYVTSHTVQQQLTHWQSVVEKYEALPTELPATTSTFAHRRQCVVRLDEQMTKSLLQKTNAAYQTQIDDLLLAALAKTVCNWSSRTQLLIGLEGHGRDASFSNLDLSGTVGWFTNLYPVALQIANAQPLDGLIKSVKEQLRSIPGKGMSYGLLRYLHPDMAVRQSLSTQTWDVVFNYLGQIDNITGEGTHFKMAKEPIGEAIGKTYPMLNKLEIDAWIADGQLQLTWNYSEEQYRNTNIQALAHQYLTELSLVIQHCEAKSITEFTPADFGLNPEVSYRELDQYLNTTENGVSRRQQISRIYPLSPVQEGMLFHGLYDQKSTAYTEQYTFDISGEVNVESLTTAWQKVIQQHSILRSNFVHAAFSIPVQCVYQQVEFEVQKLDLSNIGPKANKACNLFLTEDIAKGFSYQEAPLMRVTLVKLDDAQYKMVWTLHHIILDGWSMPIVIKDLLENYEAIVSKTAMPIRAEDHYEDFIGFINRQDNAVAQNFWRTYMQGFDTATLLPFVSNGLERNKGGQNLSDLDLIFNEVQTQELRNFVQQNRMTTNTLFQGVWSFLLSNYTGSEETTFGVTVSGRPDQLEGADTKVGMYINTLPLRVRTTADQNIIDWLLSIQNEHTKAREFQHLGLNEIKAWTSVKGDFFDSILVFKDYPVDRLLSKTWALNIENLHVKEQTNYLLTINVELSDTIHLNFNYNGQLLPKVYVEMIRQHFAHVLQQIVKSEHQQLSDLNWPTELEQQQLLQTFNNTQQNFPQAQTFIDLFEAQAQQNALNPAFRQGNTRITYGTLDEKANRLAQYLRQQGVADEDLVVLCCDRSPDLIIALLGVLKCGASFVPIDPNYPQERIDYVIENADARFVVSQSIYAKSFEQQNGVTTILLDQSVEAIQEQSSSKPVRNNSADSLAYVIYTSGSTGKPKGVMIENRSLVNFLYSMTDTVELSEQSSVLALTTCSFDIAYLELFGPLLRGGQVFLAETGAAADGFLLQDLIAKYRPSHVQATPSTWQLLVDSGWQNQEKVIILSGGEAIKDSLKNTLTRLSRRPVWNLYGPTETTIWSTAKALKGVDKVNIGRPIANTSVYIVRPEATKLQLVPIGVIGELYIGGAGLARGYFKRPDLTAERFIDNPFIDHQEKIYRTGDLARWLPNGEIECLGRVDNQVKIRGYRIELGEIESVLQSSDLVKACALSADADANGTKRLIAYVVPTKAFDKKALQLFLIDHLPDYMVPALWMEMEQLPLTPNGKIDRKALPAIDANLLLGDHFLAPQSAMEKSLAKIWTQLLSVEKIGIRDDFFDLGGHSLLATRMASAIRQQLNLEVSIRNVFSHSSIEQLAQHLAEAGQATSSSSIELMKRPSLIPLSYAQERLWFLDQLEGTVHYHMPLIIQMEGPLDAPALEAAFKALVERHEVLRTVFKVKEATAFQEMISADQWQMTRAPHPFDQEEQITTTLIEEEINRPFDLTQDYMLRAKLWKIADQKYMLVATLHHIAADGWSLSVLVNELAALYRAKTAHHKVSFPSLPLQYADYALWQRRSREEGQLEDKMAYWATKLADAAPLNLPTDFSRPAVQSTKGNTLNFQLDQALCQSLQAMAQREEVTLFMLLLTVFKVLLHRYSAQTDIAVGTPIANRTQSDLEPLIGFFVNTLCLRSDLSKNPSFAELLQQVKTTTMEAYAHQEIPFEKIVEHIMPRRDRSRSPLFQVLFSLHNNPKLPTLDLGEVQLTVSDFVHQTAQYDLTFNLHETSVGLRLGVEYCTDLFAADSIQRMVGHFQNLLRAVLNTPEEKIAYLPMLASEEQAQILAPNSTSLQAPVAQSSFLDLFESQVQQSPDAIALTFEEKQWTYRELDKQSRLLAGHLHTSYQLEPDDIIGVMMHHSDW
ncbi:MAG: amino acid adenylation domain-containing protein, partial [Bacteroidota bacterium]